MQVKSRLRKSFGNHFYQRKKKTLPELQFKIKYVVDLGKHTISRQWGQNPGFIFAKITDYEMYLAYHI